MEEKFRPIRGYEGYYEIGDMGTVRSCDRVIIMKNGLFHHRSGAIRRPQLNGQNGLLQVMLIMHKKARLFYIHRLVADAWVDNPNGFDQVTHINGDNKDNSADNLAWVCSRRLKRIRSID